MIFDPAWADAISSIESGGKYGILGPATRSGDRAYGRYQVMGSNIPQWTKEALGQPLTPQQFLASPQAQDAVFQAKFGQYAQKYGPEGAAKAWFAGERGMNNPNAKDLYGTTVSSYASRFNNALGQAPPGQSPTSNPALAATPPNQTGGVLLSGLGQQPQQATQQQASPSDLYGGLLGGQQQQQQGLSALPSLPQLPQMTRRPLNIAGLLQLLQNAPPEVRGLLQG